MHAQLLSQFQLFATPWTVAGQVPLAMGFSRQEYWNGLPFPPPVDLPDPGIKPRYPVSPALTDRFFITLPSGKPTIALLCSIAQDWKSKTANFVLFPQDCFGNSGFGFLLLFWQFHINFRIIKVLKKKMPWVF